MDRFKDMANDAMNSQIAEQLKGIDFPIDKENLLNQLEKKGVPNQIVEKIRTVDTSRFSSFDDLKQKAGF